MKNPSREQSARDFYWAESERVKKSHVWYQAFAASLFLHVLIFLPDHFLPMPENAGNQSAHSAVLAVLSQSNANQSRSSGGNGVMSDDSEPQQRLSEQVAPKNVATVLSKLGVSTVASSLPEKKERTRLVNALDVPSVALPEDNLVDSHIVQYRLSLARASRNLFVYPAQAKQSALEGRVVLSVQWVAGLLPYVRVEKSSGHLMLDEHARNMMVRALSQVSLPDALHNRSFAMSVPVEYRLAE
jgi:TonB family protein